MVYPAFYDLVITVDNLVMKEQNDQIKMLDDELESE